MKFTPTPIDGAVVIDLDRMVDERGFFARAWDLAEFSAAGIDPHVEQMNMSTTVEAGTFRGFHWNPAPHGEAKTVRCIAGSVFDVIVDMRPESPTLHRWFGVELTADNLRMLHIPEGVANGFLITADDTTVLYTTNRAYVPGAERGARFDDPLIGVEWPIAVTKVSQKDRAWPPVDKHLA